MAATFAQLCVTTGQRAGVLLNYDYKTSWLYALLTMEQIHSQAFNERGQGREEKERERCKTTR